MTKLKSLNTKSGLLVIVLLLALVINIYIINFYTLFESRLSRLLTVLVFFIIFLYYKGYKEIWVLMALSCFLISNFFMMDYEHPICNKLTSLISISGYWFLIYHVIKKVEIGKFNYRLIIIYMLLIIINFYGWYLIFDSIYYLLDDDFQKLIIFAYGTTIITTCVVAANYNYKYGLGRSIYFAFFVFAFAISDFCAVLAYYFKFDMLYNLDRPIYLFALCFIVLYVSTKPDTNKNYWIEE